MGPQLLEAGLQGSESHLLSSCHLCIQIPQRLHDLQCRRWWQCLQVRSCTGGDCNYHVAAHLDVRLVSKGGIHSSHTHLEHQLALEVILNKWEYFTYSHGIALATGLPPWSAHTGFKESGLLALSGSEAT